MTIANLSDFPSGKLKGQRVLVRVDFNVPMDGNKHIVTDRKRLIASLPTIQHLLQNKAKVILISHFGRPKGEKNLKYSLAPVAKAFAEILGQKVSFLEDCIGESIESSIADLREGKICLLENVRFHPGEEKNDPDFSTDLARLADIYVNDAFGAAHRAHASTVGVTEHLDTCLAGFLLNKEVQELGTLLDDPERPFLSIVGGSKISSKLDILRSLISKSDVVLVGGGMAYTFLKAEGGKIGHSLLEEDRLSTALEIKEFARQEGTALIFPNDNLCVTDLDDRSEQAIVYQAGEIPDEYAGFDIGPVSRENFARHISQAQTILWNGPVGVFEDERFTEGSKAIAQALVKAKQKGVKTVIGGGDSAAAVSGFGYSDNDFGHISTGGGASLEFLSGVTLPGVQALQAK